MNVKLHSKTTLQHQITETFSHSNIFMQYEICQVGDMPEKCDILQICFEIPKERMWSELVLVYQSYSCALS